MTAALAAAALTVVSTAARADFLDDVRQTFQTDISRNFEYHILDAFGGDRQAKPTPPAPQRITAKPPPARPVSGQTGR